MKEYVAYLFDADGTLLDTKESILVAFEEMGRRLELDLPPREVIAGTVGLPLFKQIRVILGPGHDDEYYDRAGRVYGESLMSDYKTTVKAFPGVTTGLRELHEMGKRLAVVTSRRMLSLEAFLQTVGIEKYFELLVTPEHTDRHKPDPDPALYAAEKLGVPVTDCVFIGDATFDIECGKSAGMDAALVSWGGNALSTMKVPPDFVADAFSDLLPSK